MEVDMKVLSHEIIGAYVCALTKSARHAWPATVGELMQDIARFVNENFEHGETKLSRRDPVAPLDENRASRTGADEVAVARFDAHDESENPLGTWRVEPFIAVENVYRDAALDLVQHAPEKVVMRLPERGLLEQAERQAATLARLGDPEKFPLPPHYYKYLSGPDSQTSVEVLASNIGYYVTASCR